MPGIGPMHPGTHLAEMLEELEITQYRLARTVGVPPRRINEIVHGTTGYHGGHGAAVGQGAGDDAGFLAESAADVRPGGCAGVDGCHFD